MKEGKHKENRKGRKGRMNFVWLRCVAMYVVSLNGRCVVMYVVMYVVSLSGHSSYVVCAAITVSFSTTAVVFTLSHVYLHPPQVTTASKSPRGLWNIWQLSLFWSATTHLDSQQHAGIARTLPLTFTVFTTKPAMYIHPPLGLVTSDSVSTLMLPANDMTCMPEIDTYTLVHLMTRS